jgi:hypothetical protein
LQVLEQPVVPQHPVKPNRPKLFAVAVALSLFAGVGATMAAETLDRSIHSVEDLSGSVSSRLIVTVPYITTVAETRRSRRKIWLLILAAVMLVAGAVAAVLYLAPSVDLASLLDTLLDRSWIDKLRHLSK